MRARSIARRWRRASSNRSTRTNPFDASNYQLVGGTAWLCARKELGKQFDYLFIDEAGQVPLADALATSLCARNVVLLGDPSQLAQVSQGAIRCMPTTRSYSTCSAKRRPYPKSAGSFSTAPTECSRRSASSSPMRCTKEDFNRAIRPMRPLRRDGRRATSPASTGCRSNMPGTVRARSRRRTRSSPRLPGCARLGKVVDSRTGIRDAIVVTPYNAQRRTILDRLLDAGLDVEVGTVDKFQGQEAAVVFYSMATSSGEDVPRNVEFLFERNRFNVAISRARAAASSSAVRACSTSPAERPSRWRWRTCSARMRNARNPVCRAPSYRFRISRATRSPLSTAPLI